MGQVLCQAHGYAVVRKWEFSLGLKMMIVSMKMLLGARGLDTIKSVAQILHADIKEGTKENWVLGSPETQT